jgi:hypothetical protein
MNANVNDRMKSAAHLFVLSQERTGSPACCGPHASICDECIKVQDCPPYVLTTNKL